MALAGPVPSNLNSLWSSILFETLFRLGLRQVVVCPGSRSGPLAVAVAEHPHLEAIPILDERSAAFFALGLARQSHTPVALICTSGTAAANFYPAVIEASVSHVPLLILTGDRPPELRFCHAGQAIDQTQLYGGYSRCFRELALPELNQCGYLRQTIQQLWHRCLSPDPGPVQINIPLRDPLAPLPDPEFQATFQEWVAAKSWGETFYQHLAPHPRVSPSSFLFPWRDWQAHGRGVIIAGPAQPPVPLDYCRAIAQLSAALGWPVLADVLSPCRHHQDVIPTVISGYDLLLRDSSWADRLAPTAVIQLGELPTSKPLRAWLSEFQPQRWIIDPYGDNYDPLHGPSIPLQTGVEALLRLDSVTLEDQPAGWSDYLEDWLRGDRQVQEQLDHLFAETDWLWEPKIAWTLAKMLPPQTPLFIASSMPVRDAETVWPANDHHIQPWFNRGANGIDGTLSTALGIAHRHTAAVLLTGDLACLHDTNGFLIAPQFQGSLTIVLVNNHGGGIFGMLPIAQFDPPFETYFATPQSVSFATLAAAYGIHYQSLHTWPDLEKALEIHELNRPGIRLLELTCDRQRDAHNRKTRLYPLLSNSFHS
ncbi:2-succinyl-5-enolpyruvyl-6-hydroxy-3-cyclohexene-1-carboxylic-acid synthase [Candidatus Synechococcus calcipolaris G9]|uniref:2-succinyl-5-enolpyruvyl-6-hydroxy-3-cyclohexene-1-carboxylate synthase n=1 Tax=Candidatus Synechococcus calcipolaris G9 TaxID=1497997 RepID=A0ABT6EY38_9SYNE|nr:2-succinyl-5-enolpyruvyl-6-hydroxy-3-cyclohexene-1-carboxylic-acid synthase [Candidatus Synechococcus calcipolaris]MDG2990719.1 2-succinyl-5-enolpyruvyl-6-hydroxy-3-cyclohexene-1-carboxylic-acid synthase [Candidatus Synechococcus calcipolaris G9]